MTHSLCNALGHKPVPSCHVHMGSARLCDHKLTKRTTHTMRDIAMYPATIIISEAARAYDIEQLPAGPSPTT